MRAVAALAIALALAGPARGQEPPRPAQSILEQIEQALCDAVDKARPSVAQVVVRRTLELEAGTVRDQVVMSGVIWSADGHIVSLGRAFDGADAIEVVLASGESRPAELVGTDDDTGVALLRMKVDGLKSPLMPATLGAAKGIRAGAFVIAISNPFGLPGSAAIGNVAGTSRRVKRGSLALAEVLQITTPVNPGDPGGLLANSRGEMIGIVASTYERSTESDAFSRIYQEVNEIARKLSKPRDEARFAGGASPFGAHGIGFALPVEQAREAVDRIKAAPRAPAGYLGVTVERSEGDEGVAVVGIREGSPAAKAGLQQNDILLRFDGRPIASLKDLKRLLVETPVGKPIELEVRRGDAKMAVRATLELREKK
jgi:serine protease Do